MSPPTVGRLLLDLDIALHVNTKQLEARSRAPDRDAQFSTSRSSGRRSARPGCRIISVDTKKKELIGNFKNAGAVWGQRSRGGQRARLPAGMRVGRAVPYGIYDLTQNHGTVYVGESADTAQFAVDVVARWWDENGGSRVSRRPTAADLGRRGGSNGCRPRVWKQQVQEQLSDRLGLAVTVCHYPTGCSKWNPIEHRLFGPISQLGRQAPAHLGDHAGLHPRHHDHDRTARGGLPAPWRLSDRQKVSDTEMATLNLERHEVCPTWNYTIRPRSGAQGRLPHR